MKARTVRIPPNSEQTRGGSLYDGRFRRFGVFIQRRSSSWPVGLAPSERGQIRPLDSVAAALRLIGRRHQMPDDAHRGHHPMPLVLDPHRRPHAEVHALDVAAAGGDDRIEMIQNSSSVSNMRYINLKFSASKRANE